MANQPEKGAVGIDDQARIIQQHHGTTRLLERSPEQLRQAVTAHLDTTLDQNGTGAHPTPTATTPDNPQGRRRALDGSRPVRREALLGGFSWAGKAPAWGRTGPAPSPGGTG